MDGRRLDNGQNLVAAIRQPLSKTKESRIVLKNEDGTFTPLMLVFDANGANWWLEKRKEGED